MNVLACVLSPEGEGEGGEGDIEGVTPCYTPCVVSTANKSSRRSAAEAAEKAAMKDRRKTNPLQGETLLCPSLCHFLSHKGNNQLS